MKFYQPTLNRLINWLWGPKRYRNLYKIIDQIKPKNIMEIGTYKGERGEKMIIEAKKFRPTEEISYYGFDLFEEMGAETFIKEVSKNPLTEEQTKIKLEKTGARINLFKGYTSLTLPQAVPSLPKMDLIFIDGGHSLETIANDWHWSEKLMGDRTVVVFDDYWNREDCGAKPIIENIDRNYYKVEILEPQDKFKKDWGVLKINFVRVQRKHAAG